ncbi:MAG: hypothetical protein WKF96_03455 [Solirubrobacteraceae bacterium]
MSPSTDFHEESDETLYQFSRAIYREIADEIDEQAGRSGHEAVLRSCEKCMERLVTDRHYFARPARTLFNDIRVHFPIRAQTRVFRVVATYLAAADEWLARQPRQGYDATGTPLQCRATTRRGTPCQRDPLAHNGYCPSHQHLAETEERELAAA